MYLDLSKSTATTPSIKDLVEIIGKVVEEHVDTTWVELGVHANGLLSRCGTMPDDVKEIFASPDELIAFLKLRT
eukprot:12895513-Prorocentrum_lima.AAC.1